VSQKKLGKDFVEGAIRSNQSEHITAVSADDVLSKWTVRIRSAL
jgi:hypothetical protein